MRVMKMMGIKPILLSLMILWISTVLAGCSTLGNVVPKEGPSMEKTYDSFGQDAEYKINRANSISEKSEKNNFYTKIKNPELKLYVFPHLAGRDELPIPGYKTVFSVYQHDYYEINEIKEND